MHFKTDLSDQTLYYRIADFTIAVHTPDSDKTRELLWTFKPFELHESDVDKPLVLLHFYGNIDLNIAPESIKWKESREENEMRFSYGVDNVGREWFQHQSENGVYSMCLVNDNVYSAYCDIDFVENSQYFLASVIIRTAFSLAIAPHGAIKVHASVIRKDGKALLFLGESGTGKSTHARLWLKYVEGAELLNDDEPIVRVHADGNVVVYGTPWSGKTNCYIADKATSVGFVHLYQSPVNELQKLSIGDAYASLLFSSTITRSAKQTLDYQLSTIASILQNVSCWRLDCRPDEEAVKLTRSIME